MNCSPGAHCKPQTLRPGKQFVSSIQRFSPVGIRGAGKTESGGKSAFRSGVRNRRQVCVSFGACDRRSGGRRTGDPLLSTHPAVAIAVELVPSGRRATGLGLPAHADAQVAVLVHAELHVGKFPGTCRVLNAHALAFLPGPPAAVAAVKERQVHAAPGRTGGRKQRHPSICHYFPSFDRRMGPVNYLL